MEAAVEELVTRKFGEEGVYPRAAESSAWRDQGAGTRIPAPSNQAIAATVAYCEYIYRRYGRFPAYPAPFRTVLGYQVAHGDPEFYDRFFHSEALTETQRQHQCDATGS